MDVLSDKGFATAMSWCVDLEKGAGVMLGTVCSSWVFLSRGTSRRSRIQPLGQDVVEVACFRDAA
eukprot:2853342-Alexandrium_andersonii.AAC.1